MQQFVKKRLTNGSGSTEYIYSTIYKFIVCSYTITLDTYFSGQWYVNRWALWTNSTRWRIWRIIM